MYAGIKARIFVVELSAAKKNDSERSESFFEVPGKGIEPPRYCYHRILSPARLPVPPPGLNGAQRYIILTLSTKSHIFVPKAP
jgi:hypothetical protein